MQTKLEAGKLLNQKGQLTQAGYSTSLIKEYDRADIGACGIRIKEWDYYIITNGRYAVALTVADNSYMSMASASFLDFEKADYKTSSEIKFFSFGKLNLPSTTESGDVFYDSKKVKIHFIKEDNRRQLVCCFDNFRDGKKLEANLVLTDFPQDYMVIATPYKEDKKAFYYNAKINCMKSSGYVKIGDDTYNFDDNDSLGTLDWGRGVWTYKNTWYWSSLSCYSNGHKFGFNLGYGFGDTSAASENMLFIDGVAHKLDQVTFNIPVDDKGQDDYMSAWTFTSNDNRLNLRFEPVLDRKDITDILVIASKQHQVFGKFSGTVTLDDGTVMEIKDCLGFAEKVYNKW